jgi:hypothetical protein
MACVRKVRHGLLHTLLCNLRVRRAVTLPSKSTIVSVGVLCASSFAGSALGCSGCISLKCPELGRILVAKEFCISVEVGQLQLGDNFQPQITNVVALLFALKGRKIRAVMRAVKQIKNAPKNEIVVKKAVAQVFALPDELVEGTLKPIKKRLYVFCEPVPSADTEAAAAAQQPPNRKKLLLHKSVQRYKPNWHLLNKWHERFVRHSFTLPRSACVITLSQPNTKRPGRTFHNPTIPPGKRPYNDGMTAAALTLLYHGFTPRYDYDEASHICGHARCINPAHLVWEDIGRNSTRNLCHRYGVACLCVPRCVPFCTDEHELVQQRLRAAKERKKQKKLTKYFFTK